MQIAASSFRYQSRCSDDGLRERLTELAWEKPRFGYRRLHVLLRRSGEAVNHKHVHRVYREAGLSLRRKKHKHCQRAGQSLRVCTAANQEWAHSSLGYRTPEGFAGEVGGPGAGVRIITSAEIGGQVKSMGRI